MTVGVFDHPFLSGLLGHPEVSEFYSAGQDIKCMLQFESALAKAQAELGIIPNEAAAGIIAVLSGFSADISALKNGTGKDGVVVPELVRQVRKQLHADIAQYFHFGATSQDVIDTSLVLRTQKALGVIREDLEALTNQITELETKFGDHPLMARTRMQNAIQSDVSAHLALWNNPLQLLLRELGDVVQEFSIAQFGGPIGARKLPEDHDGQVLAERLAEILGLNHSENCWHTDRTGIVKLADWLSRISGILGKIGRDIVLLNLNEVSDIALSGAGGSSAMAHKNNPVKAEILETLALFNATQVSAMHHALAHEHRRSGSRWTLEWMILPQMVLASATGIRNANELLRSVTRIGKVE